MVGLHVVAEGTPLSVEQIQTFASFSVDSLTVGSKPITTRAPHAAASLWSVATLGA